MSNRIGFILLATSRSEHGRTPLHQQRDIALFRPKVTHEGAGLAAVRTVIEITCPMTEAIY